MKYIFQFESFSSLLSNPDNLYKIITGSEFYELLIGDPEEISEREMHFCNKMVGSYLEKTGLPIINHTIVKRYNDDIIKSCISYSIGDNHEYYIIFYKFKDDWWLIEESLPTERYIEPIRTHWVLDSLDGIKSWSEYEEYED